MENDLWLSIGCNTQLYDHNVPMGKTVLENDTGQTFGATKQIPFPLLTDGGAQQTEGFGLTCKRVSTETHIATQLRFLSLPLLQREHRDAQLRYR